MKNRLITGVQARESRTKRSLPYPFVLSWNLPEAAEVLGGLVQATWSGGIFEYNIRMKPGRMQAGPHKWSVPPHQSFANLKVVEDQVQTLEIVDPRAMTDFLLHFGQLGSSSETELVESTSILVDDKGMPMDLNRDSCEKLANSRSAALIRYVWRTGSDFALDALASSGEKGSRIRIDPKTGAAAPEFLNVWSLICYLTVRDLRAGRLGICANPACKAPYFLKARRTQKICENPECSAWAQRRYALKWWQDNNSKPKSSRGTK